MTINFGGEAWVSHVMLISVSASVSYILPRAIYCAYLPGLFTWNMIYSLGTAPRYLATFARFCRFYLSSANFNTYIQYHRELRYDRTLA